MNALVYGSYFLLAVASLYFLIRLRTEYLLYSVAIFLTFLGILGAFFRIMHWPGADELMPGGMAGTVLGGGLLVWKSLRNHTNHVIFNKLMAGLIILIQVALIFLPSAQAQNYGPLLNYPIAALIGTVLLNDQAEHRGEKNMLMLFLFQALIHIAVNLLVSF